MHILQVTPHYYPEMQFGGPPRKIHSLSRGLALRGANVSVVTMHSNEWLGRRMCEYDGVATYYLSWFGYGTKQVPLSIAKLKDCVLRSELVHISGLYNLIGPIASRLAHQLKRPVVCEPLGMYAPKGSSLFSKRCYHQLFTRRMFRQCAAVVVASDEERNELTEVVDAGKLVVRRNGVEVSEFTNLPPGSEFLSAHHLPPNERIVLFLGRISPIKNLELLMRAFASADLPGTKLVLAGPLFEADYVKCLRSVILKLEMTGRILLAGPVYDRMKLSALAAASLLVLPSLSESFGNAAAEAVAAGVPVLLTETCGIAKLIHGRAGLAVPTGQEALAAGLRIMLSSDREQYLGRQDEVILELSWKQPLDQTEELYSRILQQHSKLCSPSLG